MHKRETGSGDHSSSTLHTPSLADPLPTGWAWCRLDEVCEGVFDCPHSTPVLVALGPYLARSQDIRSGVFRTEVAARVSEETYLDRVRRAEPVPGDLLYSREGTYFGIAAEVPSNVRVCLGQRMVLIRPEPRVVDFRYLRFWLNSPILAGHVYGHRDGTVAERLNLPTIRGLPVPVAPLPEQAAIGQLLGTLDDKIDLNRRMNETLEAMAGALFRSWFVDFDPVRAKQEGRQPPGLDAATAALFPDSFADSPLGPIPTGWRPGHFGDVADHPRRVVNPLGIEPETPYIGLEHMPRRSIALTNWGRSGDVTSQKARFNRGEILFGKLRPYFHKVGVAAIDGVCSTDILVVVPKRPQDFGFVLGHVGSGEFISHTDASSGGTRMPRTNWAEMSRYSIVIPPDPVSKAFTSTIRPLVSLILSNIHQSQTLAALRDALLPKLLSGELRVRSEEPTVEAVS